MRRTLATTAPAGPGSDGRSGASRAPSRPAEPAHRHGPEIRVDPLHHPHRNDRRRRGRAPSRQLAGARVASVHHPQRPSGLVQLAQRPDQAGRSRGRGRQGKVGRPDGRRRRRGPGGRARPRRRRMEAEQAGATWPGAPASPADGRRRTRPRHRRSACGPGRTRPGPATPRRAPGPAATRRSGRRSRAPCRRPPPAAAGAGRAAAHPRPRPGRGRAPRAQAPGGTPGKAP